MKLQASIDDNEISSMQSGAQMENISAELREFCQTNFLRHHISSSAMLSLLQDEDYDILIWLYHCICLSLYYILTLVY